MNLSKVLIRDLIVASAENRLYFCVGHKSFDYPCENCGKAEPAVMLSICATAEDVEDDPCSGDIVWLGTSCFNKLGQKYKSLTPNGICERVNK